MTTVAASQPVVASRAADAPRRWQAARNVLAVRLDNLGDVLMTTPALAALRESLPSARLTLLASPSGAALAPHLPMVDDVIAYAAPWVKHPPGDAAGSLGEADCRMIDRLAERRFDAAVVFTVCTQSALPAALLCRLAGIGLRLAHSRENPYDLLTDWVPDADRPAQGVRHEARRQLDLVAAVGCATGDERLKLRYAEADVRRLGAEMSAAGIDAGQPYYVVHPGATAPSRRWPNERWGRVAQALFEATGCRTVFAGGAGEQAAVAEALAAMDAGSRARAVSLAGRLGLGELAALIHGARVTLCNNSAPAHMAAAVGAPVVVLYALTNPQHAPWQVASRVLNRDVPCRDCLQSVCPQPRRACLDDVPADDAVQAALDLLAPSPATAAPCLPVAAPRAAPPVSLSLPESR